VQVKAKSNFKSIYCLLNLLSIVFIYFSTYLLAQAVKTDLRYYAPISNQTCKQKPNQILNPINT
jgi:hypothetical protein